MLNVSSGRTRKLREAKLKMSGTWVGGQVLSASWFYCPPQEVSVRAHRGPFEAWDILPLLTSEFP